MTYAYMHLRRGRWSVFVALLGEPDWPSLSFTGTTAPTVEERSRALTSLGYAAPDGIGWSWTEDRERPADPTSAVVLIAKMPVRLIAGGAS
ncbi:DUF6303 family protein [Streptomyces sp. NBC_01551]|uniref:DUF6303 family protein n=1 Tax=Streptomyces sp. NBC_01551 TaxID=2975876 RepID=UPI0022565E15|nr:DUF6303 family protein [Streptomyces sp. NBC_01551]MCX4529992.1 DUF6303 family protein [Streptomyces sp. NBC_01551]